MKAECIQEVAAILGRQLSVTEARDFDEKVASTMRRMAARDPAQWRQLPREERLAQAAKAIATDLTAEAERKQRNAAMQVLAVSRHVPEIEAAGKDGFKAIQRKLAQAEVYIKGVQRDAWRQALDALDYATTQTRGNAAGRLLRWATNFEDPVKTRNFVHEAFGRETGDLDVKAAAKAWGEVTEGMGQRFNRAGGDIRKLSSWRLPQPHDGATIREAGLEKWVREVMPLIDRSRYFDIDGRPLTNEQIGEVLEMMWRTISSDGANQIEPGSFRGGSSVANRYAESRQLHFRGPDEYLQYMRSYGHGSVFDAMQSHIGRLARDIALVETFGPNPAQTVRTMLDTAAQAGGRDRVALFWKTEDSWNVLSGALDNPQSQTMSRVFQGGRNLQVAGKLQASTVFSINDLVTYFATVDFNRLGFLDGWRNLARAFGKDAKQYADQAGLIADSMIGDMAQWADGKVGTGWTRGLANSTMKLSLMNAWTDGMRRAFSTAMMGGLGRISRTAWDALDNGDRLRLQKKGWTDEEWALVNRAEPETWRETKMLTPRAVYAIEGADLELQQRVAARLLGTITDEAEYASINPNLTVRTIQSGGLQRGTFTGELWRSAMLFKGYSFGMVFRHWERALFDETLTPMQRTKYASALLFGNTLFAAMAIQAAHVLFGRDPVDMTGDGGEDLAALGKFWFSAFMRGGGGGFFADFLAAGVGRQGQSGGTTAVSTIAGPLIGSAAELGFDLVAENVREAAQGKDTHAAAEALRWLRSHTPLVNLWYARLAVGDQLFHSAQDYVSPGYLDRIEERARKQNGQKYWYLPGSGMEPRAPDFEAAVGR